jgi:hypothetical protein
MFTVNTIALKAEDDHGNDDNDDNNNETKNMQVCVTISVVQNTVYQLLLVEEMGKLFARMKPEKENI